MAEPIREIETDVLVVGGGTAGFAAALSAARSGLRVRLIEAGPKIGGVMASCPGMPWGGGYPLGHSIGGIFAELTGRLLAMAPPAAEVRPCALENFGPEVQYDHDAATLVMFDMPDQEGLCLPPQPPQQGERDIECLAGQNIQIRKGEIAMRSPNRYADLRIARVYEKRRPVPVDLQTSVPQNA
jgi:choline dehydrogenase-like flavoprotein